MNIYLWNGQAEGSQRENEKRVIVWRIQSGLEVEERKVQERR